MLGLHITSASENCSVIMNLSVHKTLKTSQFYTLAAFVRNNVIQSKGLGRAPDPSPKTISSTVYCTFRLHSSISLRGEEFLDHLRGPYFLKKR